MKKTILLVNLGTPDSYKPKDVYKYLIEFLTDKRVITLPFLKRQLLVRGIIVPFRYKMSAKSYQDIWSEKGSPLLVYGRQVQKLLQEALGNQYDVKLAMRYQSPSLEKVLKDVKSQGSNDLTVIPLFPQYSSACTGSIYEKVFSILSKWNTMPHLRFISEFYKQDSFIKAHVEKGKKYDLDSYDHILFSFHSLPKKHLIAADDNNFCLKSENCCQSICQKNSSCYSAQCHATANLIAQGLNLEKSRYSITFQSRLGKDPWLSPFTAKVLEEFPKRGIKKVLVFCPSFICDCLETLYEMQIENDHLFKESGGETLTLVENLNDHPLWIQALEEMVLEKEKQPLEKVKKPLESMLCSS